MTLISLLFDHMTLVFVVAGLNPAHSNVWEDALSDLSSFLTLISLLFYHLALVFVVVGLNPAHSNVWEDALSDLS